MGTTLCCFYFCHLLVNASFLRLEICYHTCGSAKCGAPSMKLFTLVSVLFYFNFLVFHPFYLLDMEGLGSTSFPPDDAKSFYCCSISTTSIVTEMNVLLCLA